MRLGIPDAIARKRSPGRADSPLKGKMVFSFGARRSGTWWLQRVITAHPAVAARPLTSMDWFSGSLEDAAAEWRRSVLAARDAERPARYLEVRYEELASDPGRLIPILYNFIELDTSETVLEAALTEAQVELNT